jgi:aminoglycoside 3-N-acetyltransferase
MSAKHIIRRAIPAPLWQAARRVKRGVELRRIRARGVITKQTLVRDLTALGLKSGDVLMVYSSLRSIGFVEGGPDTVIDALMDVVGPGGTLAFPTFTIAGTMSETLADGTFVFDPATSPSTVGKITEVFRHRPGVFRSLHPTHSVAAWGRLAREVTATHLEDGTNFGASSPFGKLLQFDAKAVGLGVTFAPITWYHAYEDMNLDKFPGVYLPRAFTARIRTPEGERAVSIRCHNPDFHHRRIDKNPEIEAYWSEYFRSTGVAHVGPVGDSQSWWIRGRDVFDCLEKMHARGVTIYRVPES